MKAGHIMPGERARVELELPGQLSYMHVHGEPEFFEKFGYDPNPIKTLKRISKTPDAETVPGSATAGIVESCSERSDRIISLAWQSANREACP